jgi:hypothetical protein
MERKQRIIGQLRGEEVDRIPAVGGWNLGVRNLAEIAGMSVERYLADPPAAVLQANRILDVDAMVSPIVPRELDSIRAGQLEEAKFAGVEPEALKQRADKIPATEAEILRSFDAAAEEKHVREGFAYQLALVGEFPLIPTLWDAVADFSLYFQYGYEAFLAATALYPDEVEHIWREHALRARERNRIRVRLYRELDLLPVLFTGCDICVNRGPMVSPEFLRQRYWPHAKVSIAPLVEAGIRVIHHCDGNVMPLVDDMIAAGFSGFQGFQYECGVDPHELRKRRSLRGETPLLMGGLSVTRTLPYGSEQDLRDEVDWCVDYSGGGQGFLLFTSNVTGVEVPPRNIVAAYEYLRNCGAPGRGINGKCARPWPWGQAHSA